MAIQGVQKPAQGRKLVLHIHQGILRRADPAPDPIQERDAPIHERQLLGLDAEEEELHPGLEFHLVVRDGLQQGEGIHVPKSGGAHFGQGRSDQGGGRGGGDREGCIVGVLVADADAAEVGVDVSEDCAGSRGQAIVVVEHLGPKAPGCLLGEGFPRIGEGDGVSEG